MPSRIIREGILTSERVDALTPYAELFYRRLMSVVDDYGRYTANPTLLRASCYPLMLDSVKEDTISRHLAECSGAGLIVLYAVAGKAFLELRDFRQQVRAKESKYPAPERSPPAACMAGAEQTVTVVHPGGGGDGDGDGDGVAPAADTAPAFIGIPVNSGGDFPVGQEAVSEFSRLYPAVDVQQELRAMRAWAISNPAKRKTRGGMMRFINSWLAKEQDKGAATASAASLPGGGRRPL